MKGCFGGRTRKAAGRGFCDPPADATAGLFKRRYDVGLSVESSHLLGSGGVFFRVGGAGAPALLQTDGLAISEWPTTRSERGLRDASAFMGTNPRGLNGCRSDQRFGRYPSK